MDLPVIEIALRVPGPWASPEAFDRALPEGYRLGGDGEDVWLYTPGDDDDEPTRVPLHIHPFDEAFVGVFAGGTTRLPSEQDRAGIEDHSVLVCPMFPGGSSERAAAALRHTTALIRSGGFGVFIDNSGLAHGSDDWLALADDNGADGGGPFWAFVNVYGSPERLWSIGMHVLGHRDATLVGRSGDDAHDDFTLRNFLSYASRSGAAIHDGDAISDVASNETLVVTLVDDDEVQADHPMHNPLGRCRLERMLDAGPNLPIARGPA